MGTRTEVTLVEPKDYYEFTPGILRGLCHPQHLETLLLPLEVGIEIDKNIKTRLLATCDGSPNVARCHGFASPPWFSEFQAAMFSTWFLWVASTSGGAGHLLRRLVCSATPCHTFTVRPREDALAGMRVNHIKGRVVRLSERSAQVDSPVHGLMAVDFDYAVVAVGSQYAGNSLWKVSGGMMRDEEGICFLV